MALLRGSLVLVLTATALLAVGLVHSEALDLVYASMACSALAALALAGGMARRHRLTPG